MSSGDEGRPAGILHRLLGYADKPWKAIVVIIGAMLAGGGFVIWDLRHELFEYWRQSPAELNVAMLPEVLKDIQRDTSADLIGAWSVDLKFNSEYFLAGRYADGKVWEFKPARAPLLADKTPTGLVIRLLSGQPICGNVEEGVSLLVKAMEVAGMDRVCLIPVPPERREQLLAMLAIGWIKAYPPDYEAAVIDGATQTAIRLRK
jgi:hypothetical protein